MPKIKVRKSDPYRCLVTEILPAETPIVFSNDGFYLRCRSLESSKVSQFVFENLVAQDEGFGRSRRYIPYAYRVKKGARTFRNLAVIHPGAQWLVKKFYQHMSPLMLHYTRESPFSIRAPRDVASSFFVRSPISDLARFKKSDVSELGVDKFLRHSSSYFSYKGHSRLYKFFDSTEFVKLEAEFSEFWMMDVSRCFDSIYTHTISWAVKDKHFAKANTGGVPFFGDTFDRLMQQMNYGETNGIVIGPEFSRIFAEVILQSVDLRISERLRELDMECDKHYAVRRYVDDFFVFAKSSSDATTIYQVIAEELLAYKLGVNESKLRQLSRPFLTPKSKTVLQISKRLNSFVRKIGQEPSNPEEKHLIPREVFKPDRLVLSFCNDVKTCCADNGCDYEEVSGYLISALKNRATRIMSCSDSQIAETGSRMFCDALAVLLRCMFFLYAVAPSVGASYKLCTAMLMIARFAERNLGDYASTLKNLVFNEVEGIIESRISDSHVTGFIDLESQNLLLAVSDLGADYRLPAKTVEEMFGTSKEGCSFFNLVTLMYYIKDDPSYAGARHWALRQIEDKLADLTEIKSDTEKALTFLDFVACPFVQRSRKAAWVTRFLTTLSISAPFAIDDLIDDFENNHWFVNWREIDLLNLLERRELHPAY